MQQPADDSSLLSRLAAKVGRLKARHEQRHRPTGFRFALAERVDHLNPEIWDALARRGNFFLRRDVLRVLEQHGPPNVAPRYALVFREEKPVAAVVVQRLDVEGSEAFPGLGADEDEKPASGDRDDEGTWAGELVNDLMKKALTPVVREARDRTSFRLLATGNLLSSGFDGIAFAEGEDPAALWPAIAELLYRLRRADKLEGQPAVVMVKDVGSGEAHAEALHPYSYRPLETEPNMVLALDPAWQSYDDYLAALDSKNRRKARDLGKDLTDAGCRLERLATPEAVAAAGPELHRLYLEVQSRAAVRLVTVPPSFLPALALAASEDFACTVVRHGERAVGFITTLRSGDTAVGFYVGFERAFVAAGASLYLRLLHVTLEDAIAWRCKRLSLGRTALYPKAGLGARPEKMAVWLRHRVPALNWVLRSFYDAVPHDEPPVRNPFKTPPPPPTPGP